MTRRRFSVVGAVIGFLTFMVLGFVPASLQGAAMGLLLASAIGGYAFCAIAGSFFAVLGVGSLFTVGGAVLGAAVWALTNPER